MSNAPKPATPKRIFARRMAVPLDAAQLAQVSAGLSTRTNTACGGPGPYLDDADTL
jgi:hypothetical protein